VMKATVLKNILQSEDVIDPDGGYYVNVQDEDTGAVVRKWIETADFDNNPDTPISTLEVDCLATAFMSQSGKSTTNFSDITDKNYNITEYVTFSFPAKYSISVRDKITNIRNKSGIIWDEQERDNLNPTVFEITGITPVVDSLGRHVENYAILKRANLQ